jgi:hypothetical protein
MIRKEILNMVIHYFKMFCDNTGIDDSPTLPCYVGAFFVAEYTVSRACFPLVDNEHGERKYQNTLNTL